MDRIASAGAKKSLGAGRSCGIRIRIEVSLDHAFDGVVVVDSLRRPSDGVGGVGGVGRGGDGDTRGMGDWGGQLGHDKVFVVLLVSLCWWIGRVYVWVVRSGRRRRADHGMGRRVGMGRKGVLRVTVVVVGLQALGLSLRSLESLSGEGLAGIDSGGLGGHVERVLTSRASRANSANRAKAARTARTARMASSGPGERYHR